MVIGRHVQHVSFSFKFVQTVYGPCNKNVLICDHICRCSTSIHYFNVNLFGLHLVRMDSFESFIESNVICTCHIHSCRSQHFTLRYYPKGKFTAPSLSTPPPAPRRSTSPPPLLRAPLFDSFNSTLRTPALRCLWLHARAFCLVLLGELC